MGVSLSLGHKEQQMGYYINVLRTEHHGGSVTDVKVATAVSPIKADD